MEPVNYGYTSQPKNLSVSSSEKNWAVLLHLSLYSFWALNLFGIIVPFVLWMLKKDDSAYVDRHGKTVLNISLTVILVSIAFGIAVLALMFAGILAIPSFTDFDFNELFGYFGGGFFAVLLFIALGALISLVLFILPLFGVRSASQGQEFKYPLAIPFFR